MLTLGDRRDGHPIIVTPDDSIERLKRISFTQKAFQEGWIQNLICTNPEILPVAEIEPAFAPLVSIGREVQTNAGSIDNLFLSPQGYLTIAETKLWRNPEARREVVGQIIDYAKEIAHWTFDDLESQVRAYTGRSIIDTLRLVEQIDESFLIDTISRNMQQGRFLLLIVGDGIRESVEGMVNFLSQTPQLYFTLALVELQVYKLDADHSKPLLVIPQVVTRTREITRAIVRIEGQAIESVHVDVDIDTASRETKRSSGRYTLSEQDFFDALGQSVGSEDVDFARQIIDDMEKRGCVIEWKQASYVVKLPDPGESGKKLTLFVVSKDGYIYPGWLPGQLDGIGISPQIAFDFVRNSAQLFSGCAVDKRRDGWSRGVGLDELEQLYDDFASLVQTTIDSIVDASEEIE
jgi:hypothetical protein